MGTVVPSCWSKGSWKGVGTLQLEKGHYQCVWFHSRQSYDRSLWRDESAYLSNELPWCPVFNTMQVVNHRTKDVCILTFKPRGWKAKDSFEIRGQVFDATGNVQYDIAGRWNSQLVARKAGDHGTDLLPDVAIHEHRQSHLQSQYILLWRNTLKPSAPFNLTPYAITLNDCPDDTLRPFLPPTDCRLRPDQRAFELGRYEQANVLKGEQEEFQRETRRRREQGEIPPHRPRWFEAKVEADTGERYWAPIRQGDQLEYWFQRDRVTKAIKAGTPAEWPNVDQIFVEAEL